MTEFDVGIDLGTYSIVIYMKKNGVVLDEPSVVAVDARGKEKKVIAVGEKAFKMIGKTPGYIKAIRPMEGSSVSNHILAEEMLGIMLKKVFGSLMLKPSVSICVPSVVTKLERDSVVGSAKAAGARKVYLIEEPVAAAIGCGLKIEDPHGKMIVDIGAGTTNIAVISLGGVVLSTSVKLAGFALDEAIMKYVLGSRSMQIGQRMAEKLKIEIGTLENPQDDVTFSAKGIYLPTGLPHSEEIKQTELSDIILQIMNQIISHIHGILEKTPPELVGDILTEGIIFTGGSSLLNGLSSYVSKRLNLPAKIAENPRQCVAIGAGLSFDYTNSLSAGFSEAKTYHEPNAGHNSMQNTASSDNN